MPTQQLTNQLTQLPSITHSFTTLTTTQKVEVQPTHPVIHLPTQQLTHPFTQPLTVQTSHPLTYHPLIHPPTTNQLVTHQLNHSPIHSLNHSQSGYLGNVTFTCDCDTIDHGLVRILLNVTLDCDLVDNNWNIMIG